MEIVDFTKDFKKVCISMNKQFGAEECEIYYQFLKDYKKVIFSKACELAIQECKFFPKVAEMIEFCERAKIESQKGLIDYMISKGYFRSDSELKKTIFFIQHDIVPKWLSDDMKKYYKQMMDENNIAKIESQSGLLLN